MLDWIGLDNGRDESDQIRLDYIRLVKIRLDFISLDRSDSVRLD